ncbi:iron-sulfur cluster assembly scaffold protein [Altererythrobacter salegens]|uniref:Iron-sulfur cluster assembly scaffold protein n=1 Tax=Croceibacterium salegens TaxID=1737568 RepID=A0A6I4SVJ4_9SPHN|nr:iron-sulfur cluster assembly scaffold protein [Croceibacterium salegens]MXO58836.1 iron-sulfur cluster assembly scaffold protein [Croceibacterium salegens]
MAGAERLYTPELLGLAVELAEWPLDEALHLQGSARSKSCGSTLDIGLDLDDAGRIADLGMRVRACAIGQAAAALFARAAKGRTSDEIADAGDAIARWLADGGDVPAWPDLALLSAARGYPARHGAIMLPWTAARDALCSVSPAR